MPEWLYYILALCIHECFHFITGKLFYKQGMKIRLTAGGFRAEWKGLKPEKSHQCIICAMGPIGNFAAALVITLLPINAAIQDKLIHANIFIGLFNLIPLCPMDGGNILLVILYDFLGLDRAFTIMKSIGLKIRLVLIAAGLVLTIRASLSRSRLSRAREQ